MHLPILFILLVFIINVKAAPQTDILHENKADETLCNQKDKNEYLLCIQNYNKKIHKRQSRPLEDKSDCNALRVNCVRRCAKSVPECLALCPVCTTANNNNVSRVKVEGQTSSVVQEIVYPKNIHPHLNESSTEGGSFGQGYNRHGSCCIVVQPRTCHKASTGFRCHHKRHKTCGSHCTSRVIQARNNPFGYMSQNLEQKCQHIPNWPFLDCRKADYENCEGCYDEYGYGYAENTDGKCAQCPDNKFDTPSIYQRSPPIFPPYYYQQPPCWMTATCGMPMYTSYGNEMMIPGWGFPLYPMLYPLAYPQPYSPYNGQPYSSQYYPGINPINPEFNSDNEFDTESIGNEFSSNTEKNNKPENKWSVKESKCKVAGLDGRVFLHKCSDNEQTINPFARLPRDHSRASENRRYNKNISGNNNDNSLSSKVSGGEYTARNRGDRPFRRYQRQPSKPGINKRKSNIIYDD